MSSSLVDLVGPARLAPGPPARRLSRPPARRDSVRWARRGRESAEVVGLPDREQSSRFARVAAHVAVAYALIWPLVQIAVVGQVSGTRREVLVTVVATAAYLPFYLRHVLAGIRGVRLVGAPWSLAAMTAVLLVATPAIGADWLPSYHVLAVSALLVLPRPWSLAVFAATVVGQVPLALALESPIPASPSYYTVTVLWRASSVFVPLWLLGAVRQVEATRRDLAASAVVRERLRIDEELRRTVRPALSAIVARGVVAESRIGGRGANDELHALVDDSRRALADVRQLMSGYRGVSLRSELQTAVTLLEAAGVDARVLHGGDEHRHVMDERLRVDLRTAVAGMLRDERVKHCVIAVDSRDGRTRIDVQSGRTDSFAPEVVTP